MVPTHSIHIAALAKPPTSDPSANVSVIHAHVVSPLQHARNSQHQHPTQHIQPKLLESVKKSDFSEGGKGPSAYTIMKNKAGHWRATTVSASCLRL